MPHGFRVDTRHLVGAIAKHALNVAFAFTTTVFYAETLAVRGGGAANHGAWLSVSSAVCAAIQGCRGCVVVHPSNSSVLCYSLCTR